MNVCLRGVYVTLKLIRPVNFFLVLTISEAALLVYSWFLFQTWPKHSMAFHSFIFAHWQTHNCHQDLRWAIYICYATNFRQVYVYYVRATAFISHWDKWNKKRRKETKTQEMNLAELLYTKNFRKKASIFASGS